MAGRVFKRFLSIHDWRLLPYAPVGKPKLTQEEVWQQAANIIRWTGARGGFIYLSYELPDIEQEGKTMQKGMSDKFFVEPILKFFKEHNIPVAECQARNRHEIYEKLGMR